MTRIDAPWLSTDRRASRSCGQHQDSCTGNRAAANLPRSGKVVDEAQWAESMRAGERPGERKLLRRTAPRRVFMTPLHAVR